MIVESLLPAVRCQHSTMTFLWLAYYWQCCPLPPKCRLYYSSSPQQQSCWIAVIYRHHSYFFLLLPQEVGNISSRTSNITSFNAHRSHSSRQQLSIILTIATWMIFSFQLLQTLRRRYLLTPILNGKLSLPYVFCIAHCLARSSLW